MPGVHITLATDPESCRAIEDLQLEVWGLPPRGLVPAEQVRAVVHNGGMLLLARDDDAKLIGYCYAFVGVEDREPILCSHMLAVLPAARGAGVGRALKLAQREFARERGFAKITWTFDPLQARNAYLNLHRLRAYARRYFVDHYGPMDDDLNRGLPTDRLLAEWPVSPVSGEDAPRASGAEPDVPWILPAVTKGRLPFPGPTAHDHLQRAGGLVAVPSDIDALKRSGTDVPLRWRFALRTTLQEAFAAGLVAVDVKRNAGLGVAAYVLEPTG
jgi:predicted GNAT superfamily acetyltransferase